MLAGLSRHVMAAVCIIFLSFGLRGAKAEEAVPASRLGDSVFRDVWHAILAEAKIDAKLIAAPRDVRRQMFVDGTLVLDCCSVPAWRDTPAEQESQLWSTPFFYTVDHLILQQGRTYDLPDPRDLRAYRVAVVQGFSYRDDVLFGPKVVRVSLGEVFEAVARGQADLAIANNQEFRRRQQLRPRPLVLGPETHRLALMARIHKSRPDLQARLNTAIATLKENGRIAVLTGVRLRNK
jgi:ABC-type amino acid transport substrate-binding protein